MRTAKALALSLGAVVMGGRAYAADTVMTTPQPEPMNYVRICDVYGAGFFYIPGTETCLKISGFVFYEIGATSESNAGDTPNYHGYVRDEYTKYMRTRVNFDARSQTEWGTLQSYIRLQSDYTNGAPDEFGGGMHGFAGGGDPNLGLDQAWLSLGGLRMGYADSAWKDTVNGGPSGGGTHSWNGLEYGGPQRQLIQYNFSGGNGFFGTISLENDPSGAAPATANYMPDVVGKIGVTQGWGTVWATVGVDETAANTGNRSGAGPLASGDTEWAASAGLHLDMPNAPGSSLRLIGYYASDYNAYWAFGEWSVLASYYQQFTPEFGGSVGAQYISDTNFGAAGNPDLWLAELNMVWTPVNEFEVRSEITYAKASNLDGSLSGFVRFTRYFGG